MSDLLQVDLSINNSFVTSQQPVVVTATLTDRSTTPRTWTVLTGTCIVTPNSAANVSPFQISDTVDVVVPAGGSIDLTAGIVPFVQSQGSDDTIGQLTISAMFRCVGAVVTGDGPILTIQSATDSTQFAVVPNGKTEFRSNKRSNLALLLRLI